MVVLYVVAINFTLNSKAKIMGSKARIRFQQGIKMASKGSFKNRIKIAFVFQGGKGSISGFNEF